MRATSRARGYIVAATAHVAMTLVIAMALLSLGTGHAKAQTLDELCTVVQSTVGRCPDRAMARAMVDAWISDREAQYTEAFGPDHGYTKHCIWLMGKQYNGRLLHYSGVCPTEGSSDVYVYRFWDGADCPSGRVWEESSHACVSPTPFDPAKNNQCCVSTRSLHRPWFFRSTHAPELRSSARPMTYQGICLECEMDAQQARSST